MENPKTHQQKPAYGMASNCAFMVRRAWRDAKSVLVVCVGLIICAVAASLLELFVTPMILAAVERGASPGELAALIARFALGLALVHSLWAYLRANTLFGRVQVRRTLSVEHNLLECRTAYPHIEDPDYLQRLAKSGRTLSTNRDASEAVWDTMTGLVTNLVSFAIYLLLQKERLGLQCRRALYALLPRRWAEGTVRVCALSQQIFSSFITGQCVEAVILGAMFFASMSLLGMPYALLTGCLIAVTALIPIVGAFIGCAVGAFLLLMTSPMQAAVFVVLFLVLQQVEGNLIYPHVVGSSVGLPSIWVLAAVTLGGKLMGIAGMLFFIPLCSVLYALFRGFVKARLKARKVPPRKWRDP